MAKVINQETVAAAVAKATDKATVAEQKRCIAAAKAVDTTDLKPKAIIAAVVASIKATPAE